MFFRFSLQKNLSQNGTFVNTKVKRDVEKNGYGFGSPLSWVIKSVEIKMGRQKGMPLEMSFKWFYSHVGFG